MSSEVDVQTEQVVQAATRLFASLGFDATTVGLIAESAGVDVAVVKRAFPSNADLYREVMWRASEAEKEALAPAMAAFTPTRQGLERVLDDYLDFHSRHPEMLGLWLQRSTGDAMDTADLDDRYARPRIEWFEEALRDAVPDPTHLELLLWTFPWAVMGFLGLGMVHGDGHPLVRGDLETFREYLHLLAQRLLNLPDALG